MFFRDSICNRGSNAILAKRVRCSIARFEGETFDLDPPNRPSLDELDQKSVRWLLHASVGSCPPLHGDAAGSFMEIQVESRIKL